ncbi:peptidase inhibitor family I36 protein [Aeromonas veronii]|uniref:peptidase inhibitor family I36 protein n=1 Tax=Aeromonas veronii TaxID=654 RepID=UPI0031FDD461
MSVYNNIASSLSISTDEVLSGYTACFWTHENYHGERLCLRNMTDVDLAANGFNDKVSSVKVRSDYSLRLYQHEDFSGNSVTLAGNVSNLGGFNDVASSAKAFLSSATYEKTTLAIGSDPQLYCTENCHQVLTEAEAKEKVRNTLGKVRTSGSHLHHELLVRI